MALHRYDDHEHEILYPIITLPLEGRMLVANLLETIITPYLYECARGLQPNCLSQSTQLTTYSRAL